MSDNIICNGYIFFFTVNAAGMSVWRLFSVRSIQDALIWLSLSVFFGFATVLMMYRSWQTARLSCSEKPNDSVVYEQNQNQNQDYPVCQWSPYSQREKLSIDGIETAASPADIYSIVYASRRTCIWGGSNAGKTNLAQQLVAHRLDCGEQVIIVDPKPKRSSEQKWFTGSMVYGCNDNYPEIKDTFDGLYKEFIRRGDDFDNIDSYPHLTFVVDELFELGVEIPDIVVKYQTILRRGREYRINLCVMTQEKTAEAMLLKGKYGLMRSFEAIIGLERDEVTFERRAWLDRKGQDCPISSPVKYSPEQYRNPVNRNASSPVMPTVSTAATGFTGVTDTRKHDLRSYGTTGVTVIRPALPSTEDSVLAMRTAGLSISEIARRLFNDDGGNQLKRVKRIIGV